jgi:hypothetical protein
MRRSLAMARQLADKIMAAGASEPPGLHLAT